MERRKKDGNLDCAVREQESKKAVFILAQKNQQQQQPLKLPPPNVNQVRSREKRKKLLAANADTCNLVFFFFFSHLNTTNFLHFRWDWERRSTTRAVTSASKLMSFFLFFFTGVLFFKVKERISASQQFVHYRQWHCELSARMQKTLQSQRSDPSFSQVQRFKFNFCLKLYFHSIDLRFG